MKCEHEVLSAQAFSFRASGSRDPGCQRVGKYKVRGKFYCLPHARRMRRLYETHDSIVSRIRAIPCGESL